MSVNALAVLVFVAVAVGFAILSLVGDRLAARRRAGVRRHPHAGCICRSYHDRTGRHVDVCPAKTWQGRDAD